MDPTSRDLATLDALPDDPAAERPDTPIREPLPSEETLRHLEQLEALAPAWNSAKPTQPCGQCTSRARTATGSAWRCGSSTSSPAPSSRLAWGSAVTASMGVAGLRDWFPGERELVRGPVGRIASAREVTEMAAEEAL
jgi:hypothetical protein